MTDKIKITGLREFQASLRDFDAGLPKTMRLIYNDAVGEVIDYARPRMPKRKGRAAQSLKARSTQRAAKLAMGGKAAAYGPWLDFGGEGRRKGRPPARPFIKGGRYVYAGLAARRTEIVQIVSEGVDALARSAGLEVH